MNNIISHILIHDPATTAIYLFGSWGMKNQNRYSVLNIAMLLPPVITKHVNPWEWLIHSQALANAAGVEKADVINLWQVDSVLRKKIITLSHRWCTNESTMFEFEALPLPPYHQSSLNAEPPSTMSSKRGRLRHV